MTATSYPRTDTDWQGLFIRRIADAMAQDPDLALQLWAPQGPVAEGVTYACSAADNAFLGRLSDRGGIAHLLRNQTLRGITSGLDLLRRLRSTYRNQLAATDLYHINWLQNALPLWGMNVAAVITVLGTDFKLLKLPGMVRMIRAVLATNRCILAPNADWMAPELERLFGDLAPVRPVNFGIEDCWFELQCSQPATENHWLCVLRITESKIGQLFNWGASVFGADQQLHLVGPNQDGMRIPDWVNYHGPLPASQLVAELYPKCVGFITLSEHSEGKPQVLLETMAAGLPIIASRNPAHEELITDGEQGLLVASDVEFQQALATICHPPVHAQMSASCRAVSVRDYGRWTDCVGRYRELYEELV